MMFLNSDRDMTLKSKMCLAKELGATYIFISIVDLIIASEGGIFSLECEDGLKEESTKRVTFDDYDKLIEYINDFYNYDKIENEFANMEGRVYTQRSDYERYLKLKEAKDKMKSDVLEISQSDYYNGNEFAERMRSLIRDNVYTANSIAASEYLDTIQHTLPRGANSGTVLYSSEEDDD